MDTISNLTQETTLGVQDTVATINNLAELTKRLNEAINRFKIGKEHVVAAQAEAPLPTLDGYPPVAENVTTSDEEIKLGFIE